MKLLFVGALFALLSYGQDIRRAVPAPDSEEPVFSLFRMPDVVKLPPQAIASKAAEAAVQAQAERSEREQQARFRRGQAVRLEGCFAVMALFGILGPALARQLKMAVEFVSRPDSPSWRELQNSPDLGPVPPSHCGRYEAPWLDRFLGSAACKWLDKIPAYDHKPPKSKLDQFLASAKFLDVVPEYLLP